MERIRIPVQRLQVLIIACAVLSDNFYGMHLSAFQSVGTFGHGMGIATAKAAEGEMVPVRFGGVSGNHMSLEVGLCYYSTAEGRVSTAPSSKKVGLAVSVNEILIGGC